MACLAETVSRNQGLERDRLSGFLLFRKARPILEPKSGTQFPYAEALQTKGPGSR